MDCMLAMPKVLEAVIEKKLKLSHKSQSHFLFEFITKT